MLTVNHKEIPMEKYFSCIVALVCATSLIAADTYVATTGDDGNDGLSPSTAKATVAAAAAVAGPGDTIHVAEGTYTGAGNQDLDWSAYPDRNIVGAGPDKTVFQVEATAAAFVNRLETQTMNPLFANFKMEYNNTSWDLGGFIFGDGGDNMDVTISNVWVQGPYDGDQLADPPVSGTDGVRNGAAIFLRAFGDVNNYKGVLKIINCCFSECGRVLAFNDYQSDDGMNTTVFQNCTLVNNADTGGGGVDGSTLWIRGGGSNRWVAFSDCVVTALGTDPNCLKGIWGVRGITIANDYTPCSLDNNLMYTNAIAEGRCYFESPAYYSGLENEDNLAEPSFISDGGVDYVYVRQSPTDTRGWKSIPEPTLAGGFLVAALALFRRK